MDYVRQYKSFINSHYLAEGIRMTAGILIPAFVMSFFDELGIGIVISLGALFVSITDSPGPIHHRRNAMIACIVFVFAITTIANLVNSSSLFTAIALVLASMFFSMFGVFGARPSSIGIAALLAFILNIDKSMQPHMSMLMHVAMVTVGGIWYMLFSLTLYKFRPYKLAQQALGECIQTIAIYFRTRARLYEKDVVYDDAYAALLQQQAVVQEKQALVRELLLKSQAITKEATPAARLLLMIFTEMSDLFERIITSYQRYSLLHKYFDETNLLNKINIIILEAATQLDDLGLAVKSGRPSSPTKLLEQHVEELCTEVEALQSTQLEPANIDLFIGIRRTVSNLKDITSRLQRIHDYLFTGIPDKVPRRLNNQEYLEQFIHRQPITFAEMMNNLTLKSDVFRHSLRITLALLAGYLVAVLFSIGHGYWILMTILVIMKPAYSLTKKRNADRIIGTIAGAIIGLIVLYLVHDNRALLLIMVLFMAANYSVMRINYFLSVLLMTPYLLLFFHLLQPNNFQQLLTDRVIDTAVGSVIAFVASVWLFPSWERHKMIPLLVTAAEQVKQYFVSISAAILGQEVNVVPRLARKNTFVALANLSDAFNRMISEPKNQQKNTAEVQRLIVLLHMLVSYIATLAYHKKDESAASLSQLKGASEEINELLDSIISHLHQTGTGATEAGTPSLQQLHQYADNLLEERQRELEQGLQETETKTQLYSLKSIAQQFNLISKTANDIRHLATSVTLYE
jgi:uncharacterized membrane protein YccC